MRVLWRSVNPSISKLKFSGSASAWATTLWHLSGIINTIGSGIINIINTIGRDPRQGHRLQPLGHHQHHRPIPCGGHEQTDGD
jgi:hypothetical protein